MKKIILVLITLSCMNIAASALCMLRAACAISAATPRYAQFVCAAASKSAVKNVKNRYGARQVFTPSLMMQARAAASAPYVPKPQDINAEIDRLKEDEMSASKATIGLLEYVIKDPEMAAQISSKNAADWQSFQRNLQTLVLRRHPISIDKSPKLSADIYNRVLAAVKFNFNAPLSTNEIIRASTKNGMEAHNAIEVQHNAIKIGTELMLGEGAGEHTAALISKIPNVTPDTIPSFRSYPGSHKPGMFKQGQEYMKKWLQDFDRLTNQAK